MKRGLRGMLLQDVHRRVEALDVTRPAGCAPPRSGQRDQVVRLGQGRRHRLLDQDVLSRVEQRGGGHP